MATKRAVDYLMGKNLPISELHCPQSKFGEGIWAEALLTDEQIVARFSTAEILTLQKLLSSERIMTLEEREPDVFSSQFVEYGETINTKIAIYKSRLEDMSCSLTAYAFYFINFRRKEAIL